MPDYQWQVQWWDPAAAEWSVDGPEDAATGIAYRHDGTAQALAETLLRWWTDGMDDGGRWRATVWACDPSRPRGEPAATAEVTRPATWTGQDGGSLEIGKLNSYKFDVIAVTTVNVRAETEDQARAMIDGLNSITTRTTGDDIEAAYGLDVSTSDYDVVNVSPLGRGYLVSAETQGGAQISVSTLEIIPEPTLTADRAWLREGLAGADRALAGDSNDAGHDALRGLAEAVRALLGGSGHSRAAKSSPALHPGLDFPHAPTARTPADPAQPAASGTATPPAARTATQAPRRARGR
jgi:hypothetical protein